MTDDKVELLLKVTHEYKVKKAAENVDWESVSSNYAAIWENLRKELPPSPEEVRDLGKDYPHTKDESTKEAVTSKLKLFGWSTDRLWIMEGRVAMAELSCSTLCGEKNLGGSPATGQIQSGVGSVDLDETQLSLRHRSTR